MEDEEKGYKKRKKLGRNKMRNTTTNLIHQHLRTSIQPSSHRIIQRVLEPLLFADDGVEKVRFVDVGCLCKLSDDQVERGK
jgi:hypothetical protein